MLKLYKTKPLFEYFNYDELRSHLDLISNKKITINNELYTIYRMAKLDMHCDIKHGLWDFVCCRKKEYRPVYEKIAKYIINHLEEYPELNQNMQYCSYKQGDIEYYIFIPFISTFEKLNNNKSKLNEYIINGNIYKLFDDKWIENDDWFKKMDTFYQSSLNQCKKLIEAVDLLYHFIVINQFNLIHDVKQYIKLKYTYNLHLDNIQFII
jgi:hypothetical protein